MLGTLPLQNRPVSVSAGPCAATDIEREDSGPPPRCRRSTTTPQVAPISAPAATSVRYCFSAIIRREPAAIDAAEAPAQNQRAAGESSMVAVVASATPSEVANAVWPEGKLAWLSGSVVS